MTETETTRPDLESWVASANEADADFPIQNLPFGVFSRAGSDEAPRVGIAIGDRILDVARARDLGVYAGDADVAARACGEPALNALMALGRRHARALREETSRLLRADGPAKERQARLEAAALVPMAEATLHLPARVGDYTDFYASISHATNVGSMFRPDNPLLPNYKYVPIGYHGRASSIVVSGTPVRRPAGQTRNDPNAPPAFGPSQRLDYELELGAFIGRGNALGEPIPIGEAEEHLFGLCLLNDWSARDIQTWEYQPLGPFLAKNFASTISPWVVTFDALEPFRAPALARAEGDPAPLPHLASAADQARGGYAITLEAWLATARMREAGLPAVRLSRGSFTDMYWTVAQLVAHHASNGCNLRPGDLLGSGTVSGTTKDSRGCLLELTWRGTEPIQLPTGETRTFLQDGDELTLRAWCEGAGRRRIGFGACRGTILPAQPRG
ncbi:MAG TPA: fumarylacetoacetase [Gemmatimonadales bacterium]|nr:fumarylacetoacetase [Gemmatimonadales bacterium]